MQDAADRLILHAFAHNERLNRSTPAAFRKKLRLSVMLHRCSVSGKPRAVRSACQFKRHHSYVTLPYM